MPSNAPESGADVWAAQRNTRRELAAELLAYGVSVFVVPDAAEPEELLDQRTATAHWVAHNAVTLTAAQPEKPVLLVAQGAAGAMMPAVGFSQKASRRPVSGYVVVDGALPKPGAADWPDAPVTYVQTTSDGATKDAAHQAELRGWTVEKNQNAADVIRAIIDSL